MKLFIYFCLLLATTQTIWAKDYILSDASAEYTVKHIFKTIKGESKNLKGKMVCEKSVCEFLVAIPAKSFISSDSNRDLNMQTILEISKHPLITVKGSLAEAELTKSHFEFKSLIKFHGIEKNYLVKIAKGNSTTGNFVLLLDGHQVERPSLLTAKIDNEVPINFSFNWK